MNSTELVPEMKKSFLNASGADAASFLPDRSAASRAGHPPSPVATNGFHHVQSARELGQVDEV